MNNLMSRDEYLSAMNEGIIGDTIKKGINKIKSMFVVGMKKVKDFITVFNKNGEPLPVVSPQAVIDHFSDSKAINVYASKSIVDETIAAGGNGCDVKAPEIENDGVVFELGPEGKEYAKWLEKKGYKDTDEYKNLMSMAEIINEHYESLPDDQKEILEKVIEEDWEGVKANRIKYERTAEMREIPSKTTAEFEKIVEKIIESNCINNREVKVRGNKVAKPMNTLLVFGAPGIGKSTIPATVIKKYNELAASDANKMCLITVDCPNIAVGDFIMPTMPKPRNVIADIKNNSSAFPKAMDKIKGMSGEEMAEFENALNATEQYVEISAPKSFLPSYRKTGDKKVDTILNEYANGGVFTDEEGNSVKTGSGGIIMFDEFLRCDQNVFKQLMLFLLNREIEDWVLGSRWGIIACTNRPCDDNDVNSVWNKWNGTPAAKDRFERMIFLSPDPDGWRKWAESKGCDELILDFIFEKSSKSGDEYPRWHSVVKNGSGDSAQINPVTPRNWERAFNAINSIEIDEDYDDISMMSESEIREALSGIFDESFVEEFVVWIDDHIHSIQLDWIIKDPDSVHLPAKFNGNDEAETQKFVHNIWDQFEEQFKEHPEECTDEMLANVIKWFGLNYANDLSLFVTEFFENLEDVFVDGSDNKISLKPKSIIMCHSAYPQTDSEEELRELMNENPDVYGEDTIDIWKENIKKFFPNRMNGDKIIFVDDVDV